MRGLSRNLPLIALAAVVAIGALLRILYAGEWSLWIDESASVSIARLRWPDFLRTLASDETNMALYYVLLRFWLHLGHSEFAIRGLSVLFSVATIPVVYVLGDRLFGRRAGFIAALLMALNAFHIRYAQEARAYSLVVLLVSLASLCYLDAVQRPSWRGWMVYSAVMTLGVYSHIFAALVLAAHWCASVCAAPRRAVWRGMAGATFVIGLLALPLFAAYLGTAGAVVPHWIPKPTMHRVLDLVPRLLGLREDFPAWQRLLLLPSLALALSALVLAMRAWTRDRRSALSWHYGVVVAWFAVPVVVLLGISAVQPIFIVRYLNISLPPLILLVAAAASSIRNPTVFRAAVGMLVLCGATMVVAYYRHAERTDWRAATRHVLSQARPGDAVIFYTHPGKTAFDYYRDRDPTFAAPLTEYAVPREAAIRFAGGKDVMDSLPVHARRIWLVLSHDDVVLRTPAGDIDRTVLAGAIQRYLSRARTQEAAASFQGNIRVLLYR